MTAKNVGGEEKVAVLPPPSPFINPKIASLRVDPKETKQFNTIFKIFI